MSLRKELESLGLDGTYRALPHTPLEALAWMDVAWSDIRQQLLTSSAISLHHSAGQYLRNNLGLWHDSPLAQYFKNEMGIAHPDDMSQYLLERYLTWLRSAAEHPRPWQEGYKPPTLY